MQRGRGAGRGAARARAGRHAVLHGRGVARRGRRRGVRSRARHGARRPGARHGSVLHARHADAGSRPTRSPTPACRRTTTTSTRRPSSTAASSRRARTPSGSRRSRASASAGITVCCGGIIGMGEIAPGALRAAAAAGVARSASGKRADQHAGPRRRHAARRSTRRRSAGAGAHDRHGAHPDADVVRAPERRTAVALRRSAGALLPGRRELGLPGRRLLTTPNPAADVDRRLFADLGLAAAGGARDRCLTSLDTRVARTAAAPSGTGRLAANAPAAGRHRLLVERLPRPGQSSARRSSAMIDAVERDGVGSTGSRLLRGEREAFADVERRFAAFKGTERALYFSSGYLANLAVLTTFPEARRRHLLRRAQSRQPDRRRPAVRRAAASCFRTTTSSALAQLLEPARRAGHAFVVTESLFSMDGDVAPLAEYAALCRPTGAALIVDEAHAVGVYGARGSGLHRGVRRRARTSASRSTPPARRSASAAPSSPGPAWAIDYLIQRARPFIFSTAPPPAVAAALDASLDVVAAEPERRARLMDRVKRLRAAMSAAGFRCPPALLADHPRRARRERASARRRRGAAGAGLRRARHPAAERRPRDRAPADFGQRRRSPTTTIDRFVRRSPSSAPAHRRDLPGQPLVVRGLFVTGTDTGVGKTVVSAALMHRYRPARCRCATGSRFRPASSRTTTRPRSRGLASLPADEVLDDRRPAAAPVSPHLAATSERHARSTSAAARRTSRTPSRESARWIVEGAGGVLVPVNDREIMADLMVAARPAGRRRGADDARHDQPHAADDRSAAPARRFTIAGVVMVGAPNADNRDAIEQYGGVPVARRDAAASSR